ncbi:alkaline phosphatase [Solibacillus kalamii]|uniref:Alkaline phosphatase n=1 Tax=Solibacillus kalamii TaxID=1748298 RepID=A0ABX3ZKX3_9BACL|nr:alkaline phosphatase [Solibacillus kalamii]MBM7664120.1 alkaline phosphatase [Solibacillus kalamii]OUZ40111.1 alkaline phosphatase [Solibacillus kalamii]
MKNKKKWFTYALAGTVAVSSLSVMQFNTEAEAKQAKKEPTNVIMLVMDGSSNNAVSLARWYKGESLAMDEILTGGVTTYSAESAITDSAPAGTALATGHKSNSGYVGVLPSVIDMPGVKGNPDNAFTPVANVLEGAKQLGKATGIVSTSEIQHATPASFSSHVTSRSNYDDIGEQQVYQNMDVILGGGYDYLKSENRKDGEDLVNVIEEKGYDLITTRDELLKSKSDKIYGSFAGSSLAYELDRTKTNPNEPSLAEMTSTAIDTLNKDKDGFFLMIEGSKIDWAAHANDPIGMVTDILSFDDAVNEALKFAKKDKNTMVIAVTDHGNSGITIGNENTNSTYDKINISNYINPLKKATMTVEGALSHLKPDRSNLVEVAKLYGLDNLTAEETAALNAAETKKLAGTLVDLLSKRADLGYTTGGHTGDDVFLYSYGPKRISGLVDNTDLAKEMANFMGIKLDKLTKDLYTNAEVALNGKGMTTSIDLSDKENAVLVVKKGTTTYEIPENKDIIIKKTADKSGKVTTNEILTNTISVYNESGFYISKETINKLK